MGSDSRRVLLLIAASAITEMSLIFVAALVGGDFAQLLIPSLLPAAALTAVVTVALARRRHALGGAGAADLETPADLEQRIGVKPRLVTSSTLHHAAWRRALSGEDGSSAIGRRRVS